MTEYRTTSKGERQRIADMEYPHLRNAYNVAGRQINDGSLALVSQETRDRVWAEHDAMGHEIARRDREASEHRRELESEGVMVVPLDDRFQACQENGEPIADTAAKDENGAWLKAWKALRS